MCISMIPAVLSAASAVAGGVAASSSAKAQAAAAEQNARYATAQADDAVQRGGMESYALRRRLSMLQGGQRTSAAAAGLDPDSGSMSDIRSASMKEGERDVAIGETNSQREAWGYNVQSANYKNQAAAARSQAKSAMVSGVLGAAGSLLSLAQPAAAAGSGISLTPAATPGLPYKVPMKSLTPFDPGYNWRLNR